MSTEVLTETLQSMKEDLQVFMNDECLDILECIPADVFAGQVIKIAERITFFSHQPDKAIHGVIGDIERGLIWNVKVNNMKGGWVSVSDDEQTGVSNTLYRPFYSDEDGWFAGLTSLAEMINEAWYLCNNIDGYDN